MFDNKKDVVEMLVNLHYPFLVSQYIIINKQRCNFKHKKYYAYCKTKLAWFTQEQKINDVWFDSKIVKLLVCFHIMIFLIIIMVILWKW